IALSWNSISFAQWVTHHQAVAQPNVPKPTVNLPMTDPRFGTTLIRISNARASGCAGVVPQYSKRQAWNADESRLLLFTSDGLALLYDGATYRFIQVLHAVWGEDVFWYPIDPAIIILAQDNALFAYHVESGSLTLLCSFPEYTFINTRGEGNLTRDGRYYAFVGQVYDENVQVTYFKDLVVYDLVANQIVAKLRLPGTLTDFDWVSISPLGNYVVVDYATSNTGRFEGVEVYDRNFNFLWQKPLGAGHSDLGIDANGDEVLVMAYYDDQTNSNFIKKYRLADGQETSLLEVSWQFDCHISCQNQARSEWCFVSTFDGEARLTDDSLSWLPFEDEIFALKLDGSGEVQRVAHHHSRRFSPTTPDRDNSVYWAEPHATVSRDAGRVLFGSNWREDIESDSSVDSYVVDFRAWLGVDESMRLLPDEIYLAQNYPNPFNASTVISYQLPVSSHVELSICNLLGQKILTLVSEQQVAGIHRFNWEASGLASGMYLYRLEATDPGRSLSRREMRGSGQDFVQSKKLILMR
ncbi:MAG: T9SS type A sorting domain-containing protein, partial [candidate division KSB1 bacterium]|nr:T9SS type A sorting domain-containing protein [candidate division KSB1 bacterium]